jgi:ABC-type multidrug transport system ATPase subunit
VFDADLKVMPGELVSLLGPNGSGKTTLLRSLATADPIDEGAISWFGRRDRRDPTVRRKLGVALDGAAHFEELTGYQNAWFFARRMGLDESRARWQLGDLLHWAGLGDAVHRAVREYSPGMRQRLALVEALAHEPRLLVLDEPTLALDWGGTLALVQRIEAARATGVAVVLATNDVHLVERLGGRVAFLHEGRIIRQGPVAVFLAGVGRMQRLELDLEAPVAVERLMEAPGVRGGGRDGSGVHLLLAPDANPARVLAALDGESRLVVGMRVHRPHLGDVFIELTGATLE